MAIENRNIFYATNPAKMCDALWQLMCTSGVALNDMLIFLPSRRAVRSVEQMIAEKSGGAAILPHLVALGEGTDDIDAPTESVAGTISNTARVVMAARMLAADATIGNFAYALPIARDLVRMADYMENEGIDASNIDWPALVDEKYAAHFMHKSEILAIITRVANEISGDAITSAAARNRDIRGWIDVIGRDTCEYKFICVCASTASVPATADLMAAVATHHAGHIILSGHISGRTCDFELDTNPYNSEYKFLKRVGVDVGDVCPIDVGPSAIEFMNTAFGNTGTRGDGANIAHCKLIECAREEEEAAVIAEIASRALADDKSVLVITPDAAGGQRIATAMSARGIAADFSGGTPGTRTDVGRAILNMFDDWIENHGAQFDKLFAASGNNLFETIANIIDNNLYDFRPAFDITTDESIAALAAIREMSDCIRASDVCINTNDARAAIADALSNVSVRCTRSMVAHVHVVGTIESRMQTADIVILSGLNEGMFPARGYENAWLPRRVASQIGMPPADRKVSLMSLDFMNLSCGADVYWTRSRTSGGTLTTESRFISRVIACAGDITRDTDVLDAVRRMDMVPSRPLGYSPPAPPADWSDVYVTELELLIHNPYAFYARHILRLRPMDDYWAGVDARTFGNIVHDVAAYARPDTTPEKLLADMDARARAMLGTDGILFHFWHRRFVEIAPLIHDALNATPDGRAEIPGMVQIAGRNVRARADRVWGDGVMDIKTGTAPTKSQLMAGNMPQLPIEAYILQSGGFHGMRCATPVMRFLQLKNNDAHVIEYPPEITAQMINAATARVTELFNMYSAGGAAYEYYETGDARYHAYDDLARTDD